MKAANEKFQPETRLLLLLSTIDLSTKQLHVINAFFSEETINWSRFFEIAIHAHLAPLVYQHLKKVAFDVPNDTMIRFKKSYSLTVLQNTRLQHEWGVLEQKLNSSGIAIVPLKGIHLIGEIYTDIGHRHLSDLDLLVKEEDLDKTIDWMNSLGYSFVETALPSYLKKDLGFHSPYNFRKGDVFIDLHVGAHNNPNFNLETPFLWQNMIYQTNGATGRFTYRLDLIQTAIYVLVHLASSFFSGKLKLANFVDTAELLNKIEQENQGKAFFKRLEAQGLSANTLDFIWLCVDFFQSCFQPMEKPSVNYEKTRSCLVVYLQTGKLGTINTHPLYRNVSTVDYFWRLSTTRKKMRAITSFLGFIFLPRKYYLQARFSATNHGQNYLTLLSKHYIHFMQEVFSFCYRFITRKINA